MWAKSGLFVLHNNIMRQKKPPTFFLSDYVYASIATLHTEISRVKIITSKKELQTVWLGQTVIMYLVRNVAQRLREV